MSVRDDQLATLNVAGKDYDYYRIADLPGVDHLPYSLKVLVENLVRNIDGANITDEHVKTLLNWAPQAQPSHEIQFTPSRVIMQDFTGVPCIVDLATMRDAVKDLGGDPEVINPQVQSDMVIDHSVQIDKYGVADAVQQNMDIEYQRNGERYQFLRWGQQAFRNFRVVPPGTGIIHQVNIEYLAKVVMTKTSGLDDGRELAYLDSCVGTDSHTTTENGLGVLGWGVGGIEAEAAMLGQPISMLVPRVVGFKLTGSIPEGVTATDVVLTITDMLRKHGVVGKFVEFYGEGIASVPLANRATIGNMGPEFGSTCGIFPIDGVTLDYLRLTGRSEEQVALVEAYAKANKLWGDASDPDYVEPQYSEYEELDLGTVVPSIAGPKRPQDRILLSEAKDMFEKTAPAYETDKTVKDPVAVSTDFRGDFDIENAYALAGTMDFDFETQPLGTDADGNDVYLKDIWPTNEEVAAVVDGTVSREMFLKDYASVFDGDHRWKGLDVPEGELFAWDEHSTYVRKQTFFDGMKATPEPVADIHGARVLALLGDSVTTDHISPAGAFKASSPAGKYLTERGVEPKNFNSYGSRRGNHEIMVRGTFGNIRLRNQLLASVGEEVTPGGFTYDFTTGKPSTIFDASLNYKAADIPLVVLAGKEYGTGSSRDWAAKGTVMLGVKAVITESFERIHRSNLIGMGVLPLQFPAGESYESLGLDGTETYDIAGVDELNSGVTPKTVHVTATHTDGFTTEFDAVVRIDTPGEADYYRNGGILQYVLRNLMK